MSRSIEQMWDCLWAPGFHSLCAQNAATTFTTVGHYDNAAALVAAARRLPTETNVWWGVHGMAVPPARGRGGAEHVTSVTTLCADYDWNDDKAHKGANLMSKSDLIVILNDINPAPTVWVNSGHGVQLYWGLADVLDGDEAQNLTDGFNRYMEQTYGLRNDRRDLASVLRMPGTVNWKADPVPVEIEYVRPENGYYSEWLFENAWLPAPPSSTRTSNRSEEAGRIPPIVVSPSSHVNADSEISPLDWLNEHFDPFATLLQQGWTEGPRRGVEQQMIRPGKDRRGGTSATYHHDSRLLNVYSTSVDPIYHRLGLPRNGCLTLKPADVWMHANGIDDPAEAARVIRTTLMDRPGLAAVRPVEPFEAPDAVVEAGNLPAAFWEARPWLSQIRQAAFNRQMSADGLLGALITRYAALIPPMYRIPPIIMAASTFDHISILVAESGGGKSGAMAVARELFPGQPDRADVVWDLPTPSGEGLVGAFFEMVDVEGSNGKSKSENAKTKTAVHFSVDEAMALVQVAAGRKGQTIGSVLCTAWSGGDPGQGNASADRKRVGMRPGTFRMSGLAAIQLSLGHKLLEDTFVQQGLSGRLVFFAAEDPNIPHWTERPEWPGEVDLPVHATMPLTIEYARSIEDKILDDNYRKQTKQVHVESIDGHLNLVGLKLSGILALMDGRTAVTESDWGLAQMIVTAHLGLRNRMLAMQTQAAHEQTVRAATRQATFDDVRDATRERQALARLRDSIIRHIPPEGIARQKLRRLVVSSTTKHRFEPALMKALEDGAIRRDGERYFKT